ncbi:MAG: hypothetical protein QOH35_700 [Acidobacteriaceae bacterium]|nr:hypothetical protein [Acidobacteriaceae bacterium]
MQQLILPYLGFRARLLRVWHPIAAARLLGNHDGRHKSWWHGRKVIPDATADCKARKAGRACRIETRRLLFVPSLFVPSLFRLSIVPTSRVVVQANQRPAAQTHKPALVEISEPPRLAGSARTHAWLQEPRIRGHQDRWYRTAPRYQQGTFRRRVAMAQVRIIDYECPNRSMTGATYVSCRHPSIARPSSSYSKVLLLRMGHLSDSQLSLGTDKLELVKA